MKIKLFEQYTFDIENDIGDEYAKFIISKFIDEDLGGKTLEDVFYEIGKNDEFDEGEHDDAVIYSIINYIEDMLEQAKKLKTIKEITWDRLPAIDKATNKFNL